MYFLFERREYQNPNKSKILLNLSVDVFSQFLLKERVHFLSFKVLNLIKQ
jgi:hypothetical protein